VELPDNLLGRCGAGDVPGRGPTHPVGDDDDPSARFDHHRVLIPLPDLPYMGTTKGIQAKSQRTFSWWLE
jgi:hypothetical protein